MEDGTSPICPCYKCHKPFLIHPNSPVGHMTCWFVPEYLVSCFWGYSWESLIPSPTQTTGMRRQMGQCPFPLFELSYHVQGHVHCSSQIPGCCHCSLHVPNNAINGAFCLHCSVPGPRAMPPAVLAKGFSEGLSRHGDVKLSLRQKGGSFIPCWQQQLVLPKGTGSDSCQLLVCRAVLNGTSFFIKTADKPRAVNQSHLLKIRQVRQ